MPSLMAVLGLNASGFKAGLSGAQAQAQAAGARIRSALGGAVGGQLLQFASVAAITGMAKQTVEFASRVTELSQRLGISTEAVQQWNYALELTGSSIESARGFFEKLAMSRKDALEGSADAVNSFKALGITLDDLKNKRLEDLALQIARIFEGADPQKFIADLRNVGGRSAGEMVVAFNEGLATMIDDAKGAGVIMTDAVLNQLEEAGDTARALWMEFTAGLAPALAGAAKGLKAFWRQLNVDATHIVTMIATLSVTAGEEAAAELKERYADQDAKAKEIEARRKAAAGKGGIGADEEAGAKTSKAAEREAAERERLAERLRALQDKNYLATLSKEEKITELHRRRVQLAELLAANWGQMTDTNRLKAMTDLEELKGEEDAALREGAKGSKTGMSYNRTSLQRIGAYGSADPMAASTLDVSRRSERHLEDIRRNIDRLANRPANGVQF